jgi:ketosteroid isomerase-like protein
MYRAIVARKVHTVFGGLSTGRPEALLDSFGPAFTYEFVGDHALGGRRSSREAVAAWFARVRRLFPGLTFTVRDVAVTGPPWRTTVLTHVEVTADGYRNELFQVLHLAWGRVTAVRTLEDLDVLRAHLVDLARAGVAEADAAPIEG